VRRALSQITENRKVWTRKSLIFQYTIFGFCLEKAILRQSPFAWEDKFKRLLLRFERIQQRHYGMKLMVYTLINLRAFCGT